MCAGCDLEPSSQAATRLCCTHDPTVVFDAPTCRRSPLRGSVARAFPDLKTHYGLAPLRVRGLAKVQLHADLTILARLSLALARSQAIPLAA